MLASKRIAENCHKEKNESIILPKHICQRNQVTCNLKLMDEWLYGFALLTAKCQ